jgi:hypothetical protein
MRHAGFWSGVLLTVAVLTTVPAQAQYRGQSLGVVLPLAPEPYEFLPYTLLLFGASEAIWQTWKYVDKSEEFENENQSYRPCSQRKPYGFPCVNNQFGLTDGLWIAATYTRSIGDLNLDWSEVPIVKDLWVQYRGYAGLALTLAGRAKMFPVFLTHQEVGVKWNILDERIRPYVGMNTALNIFVDPAGLYGNVSASSDQCQREASGEDLDPRAERPCADADVVLTSPSTEGIRNALALYANLIPIAASLQPEAGIEFFIKEDLSIQLHAQPILYITLLPPWVFRAPFLGNISARVGLTVSTFF